MDDTYPTAEAALEAAQAAKWRLFRRGRRYVATSPNVGEVRILQHPDETWRWAKTEEFRLVVT